MPHREPRPDAWAQDEVTDSLGPEVPTGKAPRGSGGHYGTWQATDPDSPGRLQRQQRAELKEVKSARKERGWQTEGRTVTEAAARTLVLSNKSSSLADADTGWAPLGKVLSSSESGSCHEKDPALQAD